MARRIFNSENGDEINKQEIYNEQNINNNDLSQTIEQFQQQNKQFNAAFMNTIKQFNERPKRQFTEIQYQKSAAELRIDKLQKELKSKLEDLKKYL